MKLLHKKFSGATSLIVVLAVGMILIVMVGGIATLSLREQRQASNTDQSNRALQTAEAGVKQAVQKLSADPNYAVDVCGEANIPAEFKDIFASQQNQQITCVSVKSNYTGIEGFLERDKALQVFVNRPSGGGSGLTHMKLQWHNNTLDKTLSQYYFNDSGFYPPTAGYENAAAIEISIVYWNAGSMTAGNLAAEGLKTATIFFMPGRDDQARPTIVKSGCTGQTPAPSISTGDYRCITNPTVASDGKFDIGQAFGISDPQNYDYAVRIKARYADTHFLTRFYNNTTELSAQSTKALIDITAKSGNLYRRIRAEKPIIPTVLESVFDSVLYADSNSGSPSGSAICKNMIVRESDNKLIQPNNCP